MQQESQQSRQDWQRMIQTQLQMEFNIHLRFNQDGEVSRMCIGQEQVWTLANVLLREKPYPMDFDIRFCSDGDKVKSLQIIPMIPTSPVEAMMVDLAHNPQNNAIGC